MTNNQPAAPSDAMIRRAALAWADAAQRMADQVRDAIEARDGALYGLTALASAMPGAPVQVILRDAIAREAADGIAARPYVVAVAA